MTGQLDEFHAQCVPAIASSMDALCTADRARSKSSRVYDLVGADAGRPYLIRMPAIPYRGDAHCADPAKSILKG